jgi:hypothetical protein
MLKIRTINEYFVFQIKYDLGIFEIEPCQYKLIDGAMSRRILIKHHMYTNKPHVKKGCTYLEMNLEEACVMMSSERMLLQLVKAL